MNASRNDNKDKQVDPAVPLVAPAADNDLAKRLSESRLRIRDLRSKMAANAVKLFVEVAKYADNPDVDMRSFMRDCGLADEDFRAFRNFSTNLAEQKDVLVAGRVKFETIKALTAVDEISQVDALNRLRMGDELSVRDVRSIQRGNISLSLEEKIFQGSARVFKAKAGAIAGNIIAELRAKADALHSAMLANMQAWENNPSGQMTRLLKVQRGQIRSLADELRLDFERVVGTDFAPRRRWGHLAIDNPAKMHLAQVHFTLKLLARGIFRDGRFPQNNTGDYSWSSVEAIRYLAGIAPDSSSNTAASTAVEQRQLIAIDLSSGSGGHPIGLEAAGFRVRGVFEEHRDTRAALKINRGDWAVTTLRPRLADNVHIIQEMAGFTVGKPTKIDLLSAAIQNSAWTQRGAGSARDELLTQAVSLVLELKPRSFLFEISKIFLSKAHTADRNRFIGRLRRAGYAVRTLKVSAADYGIPQERKRAVLVGLLDGGKKLATLKLPRAKRRSVYDQLVEVAFREKSLIGPPVRNARALVDEARQIIYDNRVAEWVASHGGKTKLIPDLFTLPDIIGRHDFDATAWSESGFLPRNAERGPGLSDDWTKLPLTVKALKSLQGFPDDWEFAGTLDEQINQACTAVPPQIIAAIATGLRRLITGEKLGFAEEQNHLIPSGRRVTKLLPPLHVDRPNQIRLNPQHNLPSEDVIFTDREKATRWGEYIDDLDSPWDTVQVLVAGVR